MGQREKGGLAFVYVSVWVYKSVCVHAHVCVTVIYLCMDHFSPGTRPEPSIRLRLSPSRCCAESSPDAAAESLQTKEVKQRKKMEETDGGGERERGRGK